MIKFKQFTAITMASVVALFGFSTFAAAEKVSSGESEAEIQFVPGTEVPEVVDPEDPKKPFPTDPDDRDDGDPKDEPTGESGPLTLDFVSSVEFGEHEIESGDATYKSETLRPFIQVTDRRGTAAGWSVTAQASTFTMDTGDEGTEETLLGSYLTFSNGSVISTNKTGNDPIPAQEVVLNTGGDAAKVVHAKKDTGMGKWINRWFSSEDEELNNNVTLDVTAGTATASAPKVGAHTSTITWTLSDAPGQ